MSLVTGEPKSNVVLRSLESFWREWPIIPILIVAALPRLLWSGVIPFAYDEARLSRLALAWGMGGELPLAGMTSSLGLSNPPLSVYLLALPYALSPSPRQAVRFVALLNVLAVAGCYLLGRRWYGASAAWCSALLFAAAPWALLYSRWLWAQSLLPPFVLLCVGSAYLALVEGRSRWLMVLPVAVALTVQLHLSGIALALWAVPVLLLFRHQIRLKPLLVGCFLAVLTWLPYLFHLAFHWQEELDSMRKNITLPATIDGEALYSAWLVTTGSQIHSLAGPERYRSFLDSLPPYEWLFALLGGLLLLAVGWLGREIAQGVSERARGIAWLLLLWLIVPIALHTRHSVAVHPHYFIVLYPAAYLAVGGLVAAAQARWPRVGQGLLLFVVLVALAQVTVFAALLGFVAREATPGGLGTPLRHWEEAVAQMSEMPVCEIKVVGPGTWPEYHAVPAILDTLLLGDPRLYFLEASLQASLPPYDDGRTLLVLPPPPANAGGYAARLAEARSDLPAVPLRHGEGEIRLLYEDGGRSEARPGTLEPVTFANGMRLLGYAVRGTPAPGETLRLFLHWQLIEPPEGEIYLYNHLLDEQGQRWGQADGYLCERHQWHAGQRVWLWYDIAISPEAPSTPFHLRTGLYHYPEIINLPLLDGAGQPAGDGVRLELAP